MKWKRTKARQVLIFDLGVFAAADVGYQGWLLTENIPRGKFAQAAWLYILFDARQHLRAGAMRQHSLVLLVVVIVSSKCTL